MMTFSGTHQRRVREGERCTSDRSGAASPCSAPEENLCIVLCVFVCRVGGGSFFFFFLTKNRQGVYENKQCQRSS